MKQVILACSLALILGPTLATQTAAETLAERKVRCEKQGEIIGKASEARLARTREAKAKEKILESTEEALKGSVPILVGYIYTLPRSDLKNADAKTAFIEQCAGFDANN